MRRWEGASPRTARQIPTAKTNHFAAAYPYRYYAADGGLVSYGPDTVDQYRRAAGYIDRILKGEKPANLPVQGPTKYELTVNLKTGEDTGALPAAIDPRAGRRSNRITMQFGAVHKSAMARSGG